MSEINDVLESIMHKVLGNETEAIMYSEDPHAYLVDHGVNDYDLSSVDLGDTVAGVANELNFSPQVTQTLVEMPAPAPMAVPAGASAPGGASAAPTSHHAAPAPTMETIEHTLNTYVAQVYETNEYISQNLAEVDNARHFDLDVEGEVHGDLELTDESVNVSALGDHSAAAGGDQTGVATGDAAVAAGDDIKNSNIATGEDSVAFDGANNGVVNTGMNSGILADGDANGAVVGDHNTVNNVHGYGNTIGDGNVDSDIDVWGDAVIGDGNQTIQNSDDVNAAFGSGDVVDLEHADIGGHGDTQLAFGGGSNANMDNDTYIDNSVNESFNDQSAEATFVQDNSVNDSYNEELDVDVEVDTTIEDSFQQDNSIEDSYDVEDSYNEDFEQDIDADHSDLDHIEIED
ncbi:MAG: hypothetical protein R2733_05705 [Acidimicrobiales bacterium]